MTKERPMNGVELPFSGDTPRRPIIKRLRGRRGSTLRSAARSMAKLWTATPMLASGTRSGHGRTSSSVSSRTPNEHSSENRDNWVMMSSVMPLLT